MGPIVWPTPPSKRTPPARAAQYHHRGDGYQKAVLKVRTGFLTIGSVHFRH